jgi:dTDP-glucose pyrophosphorylase
MRKRGTAHRVGIVPAAGRAERWGGMMKELMPLRHGRAIIDHTIDVMFGAVDHIVVVTSMEKLPALAAHVSQHHGGGPSVSFTIQHPIDGPDILGAIVAGCETDADRYMFAMPDTVYNPTAFDHYPNYPFAMGMFETTMPERFGVLTTVEDNNGKRWRAVVNKRPAHEWPTAPPYHAWGVLTWTRECVEAWRNLCPETYTDAINQAIHWFGANTWQIDGYYDFASHAAYLEYFLPQRTGE